jgi:hypothetical protein
VAINHTRLADAKQRPGKQRLLGNNLVAVNRALANHGVGTSQCLATAVYDKVSSLRGANTLLQGQINVEQNTEERTQEQITEGRSTGR